MTKSFTALSILKLRDEGKLTLDDPAERYVPELAGLIYPTTDSPRLTIRHLLSHSAGFPEDNPCGDRQLDATDDVMGQMMRGGIPFSNPPGIAYENSNYGFAILGRIVARVSRQPYATYVRENILEPLGMTSTTMEAAQVSPDRLAHGYRWEDEQWKDEPPLPDVRFNGRHAHVDARPRSVGGIPHVGLAAAERSGGGARSPLFCARDAGSSGGRTHRA